MRWQTRLWVFTCCIFFTSASYTMVVPFLPIYLLHIGATMDNVELWSAAVFSISFLIGGTMAPVWGKLADKQGQKLMAARSALLLCLAYSSGGIVQSPLQLLGMRVLQGFANGYLPSALSMISSTTPRERIGYALGVMQSSQLVGTVSGPLIGGILAHVLGIRASFFVAGAALLLIFVVTVLTPSDKSKTERAQAASAQQTSLFNDIKVSFKDRAIGELLLLFFAFNLVMVAIQPILSLFVAELSGGIDNDNVEILAGLACSLPPLVGAITAPFWGMFGQNKGFFLAMGLGFAGAGFFIFLQGFSPNITYLLITSVGLGLFIVGIVPSINALLTLNTPPEFRGRGFGMMTMSGQYGAMCGPLISGLIAHLLNLHTQFLLSGALLMLLSIYAFKRQGQERQRKLQGRLHGQD